MNCYHHFTIEERTCLRKYYMEGLSFRKIAKLLGRSPIMEHMLILTMGQQAHLLKREQFMFSLTENGI